MAKPTQFKELLRRKTPLPMMKPVQPVQEPEKKEPPSAAEVFTDLSVCRALGVRRRTLVEARTEKSRGRDWDAVKEEVGMTKEWVLAYAARNGLSSDLAGLEPVSGRYVSVRLVGTTQNRCICIGELVATGRREFVRVRNLMQHPIHLGEHFDCFRIDMAGDNHLEWTSQPNEVKY